MPSTKKVALKKPAKPMTSAIITRKAQLAKTSNAFKAELAAARAEHEEGMEYLRSEVEAGRQPRSQLVKAQKRFALEVKAIKQKIASNMSWAEFHKTNKGRIWTAKDMLAQAGKSPRKPAQNKVAR